ncbi:MAG: DUF4412 domain-containing protein [Acidobacteriota bacterium]
MKRFLLGMAAVALVAVPLHADVTVKATQSGKMMMTSGNGQVITYIKGLKMRTEMQIGNDVIVSILDLDAQKSIMLNTKKREAEVYDIQKIAADLQKSVGTAEATMSFKANGQTKQIAGENCSGYDITISMPTQMEGMTITMGGPAWIAKGAAGGADFAAFFKAAASKGFFFSDPQQAKAQPAQAKGMAEMYRAIAETGGVLYAQELNMSFEGGPMAGMMNKMGAMNIATTVTSVSTEALADDLFKVPADYKVKTK